MRKSFLKFAMLVVVSLVPSIGEAFQTFPASWSSSSVPVDYWVNLNVSSNPADDIASAQTAADAWGGVANFSYNYMGTSSDTNFTSSNLTTTIMSVAGGAPDGAGGFYCNRISGFAPIWFVGSNVVDAAVVICTESFNAAGNLVTVNWSCGSGNPGPTELDLTSTISHELGHVSGLNHSCDFTTGNLIPDCPATDCGDPSSPLTLATMCSRGIYGSILRRDIDADDVSGIQSLYGVYNPDTDGDGIENDVDNCPTISNVDQLDTDGDDLGDVCDPDDDNDSRADGSDNCPLVANADQLNFDNDSFGNACDTDDDNDGVLDASDACPLNVNDNIGDPCDHDEDNDGVLDTADACPLDPNDNIGNGCNHDEDNDGVLDASDACPFSANDSIGDPCNHDEDGDGYADTADNCPLTSNADQLDTDGDAQGNVCDLDDDNDGDLDTADNCPLISNPNQADYDCNGVGRACQSGERIVVSCLGIRARGLIRKEDMIVKVIAKKHYSFSW